MYNLQLYRGRLLMPCVQLVYVAESFSSR